MRLGQYLEWQLDFLFFKQKRFSYWIFFLLTRPKGVWGGREEEDKPAINLGGGAVAGVRVV